jgi:hypothetical protein
MSIYTTVGRRASECDCFLPEHDEHQQRDCTAKSAWEFTRWSFNFEEKRFTEESILGLCVICRARIEQETVNRICR